LPYQQNSELPEGVRENLPEEAQTTWRQAFNSAVEQGKAESEAAQIAWGAVKRGWKKDSQGAWVKKAVSFIYKNAEQRYTLGVVYEPNTVDSQGDFAEAPEIEKACWEFSKLLQGQTAVTKTALQLLDAVVKAVQKNETVKLDVTELMSKVEKGGGTGLGYMHSVWSDGLGDIVENYIAPVDMVVGDQQIKKGTWLMGIVWSPEYFEKVKNNEITGLSMGGTAVRIPAEEGGGQNASAQ